MLRVDDNQHISGSINFYIEYSGPLGGLRKQVKIDITRNEILEFPAAMKLVFVHYSDGHLPTDFKEKIESKLNEFKSRWHGSLANQIKDIPDFSLTVRDLNKHLRKI